MRTLRDPLSKARSDKHLALRSASTRKRQPAGLEQTRTTKGVKQPAHPDFAIATTRDALVIHYRAGTSDIKAMREACANLVGEQKRTSSYLRVRNFPKFTIEKGDVWLDCGAHLGSFTLRALKNGADKVISVEPESNNVILYKKNIEANALTSRCTLEICAVVAEQKLGEEQVPLYITKSTYRHTLLPVEKHIDAVLVQTITLTGLLEKHQGINAVKLDIEGNEKLVLESVNWKSTRVKKLVFEYSFDHHSDMNDFHDLVAFLKEHFAIVYHHASIPPRGRIWDTKITRGANGRLVWCCGILQNI